MMILTQWAMVLRARSGVAGTGHAERCQGREIGRQGVRGVGEQTQRSSHVLRPPPCSNLPHMNALGQRAHLFQAWGLAVNKTSASSASSNWIPTSASSVLKVAARVRVCVRAQMILMHSR